MGSLVPASVDIINEPAGQSELVMKVRLEYFVVRSVRSSSPLLIEYVPDLTRSVSISQGASPSVNQGATGNSPSSNPSKYNDPSGPSFPPPATVGTNDSVSFEEMVGTKDEVTLPMVGTMEDVTLLTVGTIEDVTLLIVGTMDDVALPTVGTIEDVALLMVGTIDEVILLTVGTNDVVPFEEMVGTIDEVTLSIVGTIDEVIFAKVGELVVTLTDIEGMKDSVTFMTDGEPVMLILAIVGTEDTATGAKLVMIGGAEVPACQKQCSRHH